MNFLSQFVVASLDIESRRTLADILARLGLNTICISTVRECRVMLAKENVALVFCDRDLADGNYRDVLAASSSTKRQPSVILTGQLRNPDEVHEAVGFGILGVTAMPYHPTDVEVDDYSGKTLSAETNSRSRGRRPPAGRGCAALVALIRAYARFG